MRFLKRIARRVVQCFGYDLRQLQAPSEEKKWALYAPWDSAQFALNYNLVAPRTLVSADRCYILESLLRQSTNLAGDVVECGVYKGGTAALINMVLDQVNSQKRLFLFDTFAGMPITDEIRDLHRQGDFSDTSLEAVRKYISSDRCRFFKGEIPETFAGLGDFEVCFCHIDLDIYHAIMDSLTFLWPKLVFGGVMVFDDYGFPTCPGAREAVDEFFDNKSSIPVCLPTGQAIVFKI